MDNSFKTVIEKAKSILILLPTKPYFDQVAAGLSMYMALREEKQVAIACPTAMTVEFNRLVGVNKISQDLGNKNLIMRFVDYKASDIERVSYDIEDSQFRLTVIPKQNINPPSKDQVDISYSGVSADTVIIVGGANETHFPAIGTKDLVGSNLVHIGVKDISLSSDKNYISFSHPSSSVSEVVYGLIKEKDLKIDEDIATNLVMGIEEGSNRFADASVGVETFAALAELMSMGGKRSPMETQSERDLPLGSIPGGIPTLPFAQGSQHMASVSPKQNTGNTQGFQPDNASNQNPAEVDEQEETPKEWLEPKIYKGTSVN